MSEKILKISEGKFQLQGGNGWEFEGFQVTTDAQTIQLGISASQQCCEVTGYFMSEDDTEEFIGAELTGVTLTDTQLKTKDFGSLYHGGVMFVNLETSNGTLQFVTYNRHNGYYGHMGCVVSSQLNHMTDL